MTGWIEVFPRAKIKWKKQCESYVFALFLVWNSANVTCGDNNYHPVPSGNEFRLLQRIPEVSHSPHHLTSASESVHSESVILNNNNKNNNNKILDSGIATTEFSHSDDDEDDDDIFQASHAVEVIVNVTGDVDIQNGHTGGSQNATFRFPDTVEHYFENRIGGENDLKVVGSRRKKVEEEGVKENKPEPMLVKSESKRDADFIDEEKAYAYNEFASGNASQRMKAPLTTPAPWTTPTTTEIAVVKGALPHETSSSDEGDDETEEDELDSSPGHHVKGQVFEVERHMGVDPETAVQDEPPKMPETTLTTSAITPTDAPGSATTRIRSSSLGRSRKLDTQDNSSETKSSPSEMAPVRLRPLNITATSMVLNWDTPPGLSHLHKDDIEYQILIREVVQNAVARKELAMPPFLVSGLRPYTAHNISVRARYLNPQGGIRYTDRISRIVWTSEDKPAPPNDLTLLSRAWNSIQAEWRSPRPANGIIKSYTVRWHNLNTSQLYEDSETELDPTSNQTQRAQNLLSTTDTEIIISDLQAHCLYNVCVSAWTAGGRGRETCRLAMTVVGPPNPPGLVNASSVGPHSLVVRWIPPHPYTGPTQYTIYVYAKNGMVDRIVTPSVSSAQARIDTDLTEYNDPKSAFQRTASTAIIDEKSTDEINGEDDTGDDESENTDDFLDGKYGDSAIRGNREGKVLSTSLGQTVTQLIQPQYETSQVEISNLLPYTEYCVVVEAGTSAGHRNAPVVCRRTRPDRPSPVRHLTAKCDVTFAILKWEEPMQTNGVLEAIVVTSQGRTKRSGLSSIKNSTVNCLEMMQPCTMLHLQLAAESSYVFVVWAKTLDVDDLSDPVTVQCETSAGVPSASSTSAPNIKIGAVSDDTTQIAVSFSKNIFSSDSGDIISYAIVASEDGQDSISSGAIEPGECPTSTLANWHSVKDSRVISPYVTTPCDWNPFNGTKGACVTLDPPYVTYVVGCGRECFFSKNDQCNGVLRPNTRYSFKVRAYTTLGFCDSSLVYYSTKSGQGPVIILGIFITLLLLVTAVGGFIFVKRKDAIKLLYQSPEKLAEVLTSSATTMTPLPNPGTDLAISTKPLNKTRPIKLTEFKSHFTVMSADSGLKFTQEFETLVSNSPTHPSSIAQLPENRPKNRWVNILPFDHARVKLLPQPDDPSSDYINATYIPGYNSPREYIATQGPLPGTKDDFWRMVWEQASTMIVMVTQLVERGKSKCEQYWPADREPHHYGDLKVQLRSESILAAYTIRIFDVQHGSKVQEVKQLHFTKWPDFGCPETTKLLIDFVQAVRDHLPHENNGPIVVHCSAGVGRTGTYIAVDRLKQHMREHDTVDIYSIVMEMRQQRSNMVQTEDQYVYIYDCVRDLMDIVLPNLESVPKTTENVLTKDVIGGEFEVYSNPMALQQDECML